MISAERAAAQAEEYGHSVKREFCFLVAHSMLHLLGYDHMTPEEAADMEAQTGEGTGRAWDHPLIARARLALMVTLLTDEGTVRVERIRAKYTL